MKISILNLAYAANYLIIGRLITNCNGCQAGLLIFLWSYDILTTARQYRRLFLVYSMKKDLHPTYYPEAKVICACGHTFTTGSTVAEIKTEICSACHPFYTGKQKLLDTARRVEKFAAKLESKADTRSKKVKREARDKAREVKAQAAKEALEKELAA